MVDDADAHPWTPLATCKHLAKYGKRQAVTGTGATQLLPQTLILLTVRMAYLSSGQAFFFYQT